MRELPILFSAPMVRAILDGRKTQTRRVVRLGRGAEIMEFEPCEHGLVRTNPTAFVLDTKCGRPAKSMQDPIIKCPYGAPGDLLWVREMFGVRTYPKAIVEYAADADLTLKHNKGCWKPSIHMPRWASRITLRVTSVRVERLQEISYGDAMAEGLPTVVCAKLQCRKCNGDGWSHTYPNGTCRCKGTGLYHLDHMRDLWDSINANKHPWSSVVVATECWRWKFALSPSGRKTAPRRSCRTGRGWCAGCSWTFTDRTARLQSGVFASRVAS